MPRTAAPHHQTIPNSYRPVREGVSTLWDVEHAVAAPKDNGKENGNYYSI